MAAAAAAPTRAEVLALFRSLLRTAKQFSDYNIREYTRRRGADAFRENRRGGVRGGEEAARGCEAASVGLLALRPQGQECDGVEGAVMECCPLRIGAFYVMLQLRAALLSLLQDCCQSSCHSCAINHQTMLL